MFTATITTVNRNELNAVANLAEKADRAEMRADDRSAWNRFVDALMNAFAAPGA